MPNIFWMPTTTAEEDRFTAFFHFLIENDLDLGQAIVDHITDSAGRARTRLLRVTDHPKCASGAKPDFLFECADFDIICEHKVASRLRPDQLETYLAIRRGKRCYVALITRDSCVVRAPVLRHPRYLRPQTTASGHFYWHELYHLISQRSDRAARDFAEYMQMLGMAPLPAQPVSDSRSVMSSVERICLLADNEHIGEPFRVIKAAAERNGLYVRPYKYSIMYTPPWNRTRMLFTVWAERTLEDHFPVYVSPSAFAEFYPSISQRQVEQALGAEGWHDLSPEAATRFATDLDRLLSEASRSLPGPRSPRR